MTNRCLQGPLLGPGYWVTRLALGAPVDALPVPIAPTTPEPLVPVGINAFLSAASGEAAGVSFSY